MSPRERKSLDEHKLQSTKPQYVEPSSEVIGSRPKIPVEFPKGTPLRKWFKQYCADLEKRRTLTSGDAELLRIAVVCRDRHARALVHLRTEGEIVTYVKLDSNGQPHNSVKPNLWLKVAQDAEKQLVAILDRLGLTPANRAKIKPTEKPKPDTSKDDALLSREEALRQKNADAEEADAMLAGISDETLEGIQ
jgi:P27 family predicted phage terminase small subunit